MICSSSNLLEFKEKYDKTKKTLNVEIKGNTKNLKIQKDVDNYEKNNFENNNKTTPIRNKEWINKIEDDVDNINKTIQIKKKMPKQDKYSGFYILFSRWRINQFAKSKK